MAVRVNWNWRTLELDAMSLDLGSCQTHQKPTTWREERHQPSGCLRNEASKRRSPCFCHDGIVTRATVWSPAAALLSSLRLRLAALGPVLLHARRHFFSRRRRHGSSTPLRLLHGLTDRATPPRHPQLRERSFDRDDLRFELVQGLRGSLRRQLSNPVRTKTALGAPWHTSLLNRVDNP